MPMMQAELKMSGITNVGMHNLSPGMVTTDLLMSGNDHFLPTHATAANMCHVSG